MDRERIAASPVRSTSATRSRSNHGVISPDGSCKRKSFTGTANGRPSISAVRSNFLPVTPANSPVNQEIAPRKVRASFEKENVKNQSGSSLVRADSPVSSKGTKHFMVPTISAASKVAASPKRKVFTERNETVRSSVSLSDIKSSVTFSNSLELSRTEKASRKSEVSCVSLVVPATSESSKQFTSGDQINRASVSIPKGNSSSVSEEMSENSETVKGGPKLENVLDSDIGSESPKLSSPQISEPVPMEDQPDCSKDDRSHSDYSKEDHSHSDVSPQNSSPPPYDPKINYLSPRPLFLHYRPNSRIQICQSENDSHSDKGIKLEENFTSDISSDTDEAAETQKGLEESPPLDEGAEDYEETCVTPSKTEISSGCPKRRFWSYFYGERKLRSTLLVLTIACLSMSFTDFPGTVISSYLHKASSLYPLLDPSENLDWATHTFKKWSVSYFSEADIFSEKEEGRKLQFANLTSLEHGMCNQPEIMAAENPTKTSTGVGFNENVNRCRPGFEEEEHVVEDFTETKLDEFGGDSVHERGSNPVEAEKTEQNSKGEEDHSVYQEAVALENEMISELEVEDANNENAADYLASESKEAGEVMAYEEDHSLHREAVALNEIISELEAEDENNEDAADHMAYESEEAGEVIVEFALQSEPQDEEGQSHQESMKDIEEAVEEEIEIFESVLEAETLSTQIIEDPESQEHLTTDYHAYIESEPAREEVTSGDLVPSSIQYAEKELWVYFALSSFAFLALAGLSSTILLKRTKSSAVQITKDFQKKCPPENSTVSCSMSSGSDGHSYSKGSRNSQMEVEMSGGRSCPPEMSSSSGQRSSSNGQWRTQEIQSIERKARRSSRVSDYSAEMSSLGSFTTYEMLPDKHGRGEDEALTPVRRSSRIRKKITSP
ncbi:hypothetical protein H6P81_020022 [Aristolochia fimbriata]|uniref:Uncharacterized protein n=1 Tax=Aristolochia fimbriata TaxID=158543 RepID=A0AAV7DXB9_ARIFI|nr:hypothetical protein H6P81_020022 [Aristolochia fimbriata]